MRYLRASLVAFLVLACSGEAPELAQPATEGEAHDAPSLSEELARTDQNLGIGSSGEVVRALHDYLTRFGYFPNEDLARTYPAWRPPVAAAPADAAVYDEQTAAAVAALQKNLSLPATGVVDAETRWLLQQPRCGMPDNISNLAGDYKFYHESFNWNGKRDFTFRVVNAPNCGGRSGCPTLSQARTAARQAFNRWANETNITPTERTSGTADFMIEFIERDDGYLAVTNADGDIGVDTARGWSVASSTPIGRVDLETVLLHELGHSLGLSHSSISGATMMPFIVGTDRVLAHDDKLAISTLYDEWRTLPGKATDIGAGGTSTNPVTWIIGNTPVSGGFNIKRWNVSTGVWEDADGGALRIAVTASGIPWVINSSGNVFRRRAAWAGVVGWDMMPSTPHCAKDIGVGANGAVWIIGCTPVSGGFDIFKWENSQWVSATGGAVRIAVDSTGIPWVINNSGQVWRRLSAASGNVAWQQVPGCGKDIGVYDGGNAWQISCFQRTGGYLVQVWNEQVELMDAPKQDTWLPPKAQRGAMSVSVGPGARPWIVDSGGSILTPWR